MFGLTIMLEKRTSTMVVSFEELRNYAITKLDFLKGRSNDEIISSCATEALSYFVLRLFYEPTFSQPGILGCLRNNK